MYNFFLMFLLTALEIVDELVDDEEISDVLEEEDGEINNTQRQYEVGTYSVWVDSYLFKMIVHHFESLNHRIHNFISTLL